MISGKAYSTKPYLTKPFRVIDWFFTFERRKTAARQAEQRKYCSKADGAA
ncbi:hypothetical protein ACTNE3_00700 [Bacillota bacterium HCP3S3_F1_1]